jgi:hypothetical protein
MTLRLSRAARIASLISISFFCFQSFAGAQQQPAVPAQAVDAAFAAAKTAFEALPEAERKSIQDDLVWASTYTGTVDGGFGKGTHAAIVAFETKAKTSTNGILDPSERSALHAAAETERAAVDFKLFNDKLTGFSIAYPRRLLPNVEHLENATSFIGRAGSLSSGGLWLRLERIADANLSLPQLFGRLTGDFAPGGKIVTYKVLKTDWFVVATDLAGGDKTYTRFVKSTDGIVGLTFHYPGSLVNAERLTVAIANSFAPGTVPAQLNDSPTGIKPVAVEEISGSPAKVVPSKVDGSGASGGQADGGAIVPPAAIKGFSAISALIVAPGRALTSERAADLCAQPSVAGKPVKVVAKAGGVALLDVGDLKPTTGLKRAGASGGAQSTVVLFQAQQGGARVLTAAAGDLTGRSLVISAAPGIAGAPVFDRTGALSGVLAGPSVEPLRVAGVVSEMTQSVIEVAAIAALLDSAGIRLESSSGDGAMTAGALAQGVGKSILAVTCGK